MVQRLIDQVRNSGDNPDLHITGIVMTMYDGARVYRRCSMKCASILRRSFSRQRFQGRLDWQAPSHGQPALAYDPDGLGTAAYDVLPQNWSSVCRGNHCVRGGGLRSGQCGGCNGIAKSGASSKSGLKRSTGLSKLPLIFRISILYCSPPV